MGAGGRDFHDFNVVYRGDPDTRVAAFTAAQIPGIDDRAYPAALAGPLYPAGIPIRPEEELEELIAAHDVDEVVLAYSDLSHVDVMHRASRVLAAGANFVLLGPHETMIESIRPVIAVTAVRTGCGKSQTSRKIGAALAPGGPPGRTCPAPDAVRRSRGDARAAVCEHGRHRRSEPDRRGARGVRIPGGARDDRVRRCRLRRDPRPGGVGGGCDHLGRRQQRLPVLSARPLDHGRGSSPGRSRSSPTTPARSTCARRT